MFLEKIAESQSKFFLFGLVSFIIGIAGASVLGLARKNLFFLSCCLVLLLVSLGITISKKWKVLIMLSIFLFLGGWRFVLSEPAKSLQNLRFFTGHLVIVKGTLVSDGEISGNYQRVYLKSQALKFFADDNYKKIQGKTILYLEKYPLYNFGEEVEVRCNLTDPQDLPKDDQFSYAAFLQKEGVWTACFNAQIISNFQSQHFSFYKFFLNLRNYFNQKINYLLPEPQSSFLRGLLYGDRTTFPPELKDAFSKTGVTHIIAISGYNITIIIAGLLVLLKIFGLSRRRAFLLILGVILFFILLSGASASVIRAGLMGVLVFWGKQLGRQSSAGRVLIIAAAVMLIFNPRLILFDAGFQLSFLSTLGLIYFSPILEKTFVKIPTLWGIKEIIFTTFSAIIFTSPLIIYTFGSFSLIAPLANLLILPVVPLAMLLGFLCLFLGIIYLPLGKIIAYGAWAILSYILKVATYLAGWEFSALNLSWPWWLVALFYLFLIYLIYASYKRHKI